MSQITTIYSPEYNSVFIQGADVQSLREKPESWEDPTHPDYIGRKRGLELSRPEITTQEAADAEAERVLGIVSCVLIERTPA